MEIKTVSIWVGIIVTAATGVFYIGKLDERLSSIDDEELVVLRTELQQKNDEIARLLKLESSIESLENELRVNLCGGESCSDLQDLYALLPLAEIIDVESGNVEFAGDIKANRITALNSLTNEGGRTYLLGSMHPDSNLLKQHLIVGPSGSLGSAFVSISYNHKTDGRQFSVGASDAKHLIYASGGCEGC